MVGKKMNEKYMEILIAVLANLAWVG